MTTEVAFPIPPYAHSETDYPAPIASFSDFQLFVNGKRAHFNLEAKAIFNGKDVTAILTADKIDVPTFGHLKEHEGMDTRNKIPDFSRLPESEQKKLMRLGLFDSDKYTLEANWKVHLQYHWTQIFQAHSETHIRHEYSPVGGSAGLPDGRQVLLEAANAPVDEARPKPLDQEDGGDLTTFCLGLPLARKMANRFSPEIPGASEQENSELVIAWVDFILTSANTWKQPIEDFTLIVERGNPLDGRGKPIDDERHLVSFCSPQNAPVTKIDADTFQVHLTNFVPKSELHIGYFEVSKSKQGKSPASK